MTHLILSDANLKTVWERSSRASGLLHRGVAGWNLLAQPLPQHASFLTLRVLFFGWTPSCCDCLDPKKPPRNKLEIAHHNLGLQLPVLMGALRVQVPSKGGNMPFRSSIVIHWDLPKHPRISLARSPSLGKNERHGRRSDMMLFNG